MKRVHESNNFLVFTLFEYFIQIMQIGEWGSGASWCIIIMQQMPNLVLSLFTPNLIKSKIHWFKNISLPTVNTIYCC